MRLCPAVFLLALLPALPGCVDYGPYDPCSSDADCEQDQFCYKGLCRDPDPCEKDEECPAGRVCLEGNCLPPECAQDNDCPDDQRCVDHECIRCACLTDDDCPPDYFCLEGCVCVEREVPRCESDRDCPPGEFCSEGTCQPLPFCEADPDCPEGMVCQSGLCVEPCQTDDDCGLLFLCVEGHCLQRCFGDQTCIEPGMICEDSLCVEAECASDPDCAGELVRCLSGRCEPYTPCEVDADCDPNFVCVEGVCEELPGCSIDSNCQPGEICLDSHCHPADACGSESDCGDGWDCIGGLCLPHVCRGPEDCPPELVCVGGECVEPGNPSRVYEVIILTPGGPIHQGQRLQLTAIALTQSGNEVAGIEFEWSSSEPVRAAVDAGGVLTGGDEAGETQVRATAVGSGRESRPVTFANVLAAGPEELRVTVIKATGRQPVAGASVLVLTGDETLSALTDENGTVAFPFDGRVADVHVFADAHDYVSILSTVSNDLLVPLPARTDGAGAGGYVGEMTLSGEGTMGLGLAGLSTGGSLLDLSFTSLLGEVMNVTVELGNQSFDLPLPARMVLGFSYAEIPIAIKSDYYVVGQAGLRTAWAIGGRLELSILGDLIGGGGGSIGEILTGLFPYFSLLDHGVKPIHDVHPLPLVVDLDDVDGDGDTAEMRPDWDNFPDLDLAPTQPQNLRVQVSAPPLPDREGDPISTALYVAGGLFETGFTPLGLSAAEAAGGLLEPLVMKMAPAHGGLEAGGYAVLVLAFPGVGGLAAPSDVAAVMHVSQTLPTEVSFETGFLGFPEDAHFHAASRTMIASGVDGAGLFRATFSGDLGGWIVYLPASDLLTFSLPAPPGEMPDLVDGARVTLDPIGLQAGVGFEDLVTFNGDDLDRLDRLARAFSRFELD